MTNFENLMSMSIKEFAEFLRTIEFGTDMGYPYTIINAEMLYGNSVDDIINWLENEAKE